MLALPAGWNLPSLPAVMIGPGVLTLVAAPARGDKLDHWIRPFAIAASIALFLGAAELLAFLLTGSIFIGSGVVMALLWTDIAFAGHKLLFGEPDWRKDLERRRRKRRDQNLTAGGHDPLDRN